MEQRENRTLCNAEAERYLIDALVRYEGTRSKINSLQPYDFTSKARRRLFTLISDMEAAHKPIDLVTVDAACGEDAEASAALTVECVGAAVTSAMFGEYVKIVRECTERRRVTEIGERLIDQAARQDIDIVSTADDARQALRTDTDAHGEWVDMRALVHETYRWLERRAKGDEKPIQSGLVDLDRIIGGFFPGELTVIGARPAGGKSQMGMNIALAAAKRGFRVAFASLEMVVEQWGQRVFSKEADINGMRLRNALINDDEWTRIIDAMATMAAVPMSFLFESRYIEDIAAAVQRKADAGEIDMLVVDYLQLVRSRKRFEADRLRVAHISHTLKDITRDLHIPVIALAQVGRDAQNTMPCMADIKDSGDLEQDADNSLFLHKPSDSGDKYVHPDDRQYFDGILSSGNEYVSIKVEKQRQGPTGVVCVLSDPSRMRYTCIDRKGEGVKG